ncbi:MAG: hypothetical protein JSR99_05025 [Proteobacteria bacterium]|nr:hypothetical protein [Pseudomonadota bacterium]
MLMFWLPTENLGRTVARVLLGAQAIVVLFVLTGCSGQSGSMPSLQASNDAQPASVAVRTMPVVPGRRARVFIFAGLGDRCEPVAAPEISIVQPPAKGDVTFVRGQETTIQSSAHGTCLGQRATGTGVYYTARDGEQGADRFAVTAKLASGETVTRTFEVTIAD